MKALNFLKRLGIYLIGLVLIAVGINLSKLAGLGISPVSSIPRALEVIFSEKFGESKIFTTGNMVIVVYYLLVMLQFLVLRKKFRPINILGIPIAFLFGFIVDFVGIDPKAFGHLMAGLPAPSNYAMRLLYLVASILIIGIGVYIYLIPKLVPMPAEGLAAAISDVSGKAFGNCKTIVDVSMISIALILQIIFLGGFKAFLRPDVPVREGTILSAICVGQVVKFIRKIRKK